MAVKTSTFLLWAGAGLLAMAGANNRAETPAAGAVPTAVTQRMSADIFMREAERRLFNYHRSLSPQCTDRRVLQWSELREIEDPQIRAQKPHILSAVLEQTATVEACGNQSRHRYWVYMPAAAGEAPVFLYAIPGSSRTWPLLHGSAWRLVSGLALAQASPACRRAAEAGSSAPLAVSASLGKVHEPLVPAADMDVYLSGAWREAWKLRLCRHERTFELIFLADGAGGGYVTTVAGDAQAALADLKKARREARRVIGSETPAASD